MKVLCIGHVAYDITIPLDSFPIENTKNRVSNRVECGGGPASNAAYLLGKWGMDTYFAGVLGDDIYALRIKKEFEEVGVHTDYLEMNPNMLTTSSFIIANKSNGSRTTFTYRPKTMKMSHISLNFTPDVILMDGQEYDLSKEYIEKYPNAITIIDAGRVTEEIVHLSKMVNYVVCSKVFAEEVTGISLDYGNSSTILALYQKMKDLFPGNVVVTLEAKGCLYEMDGFVKIMPSLKVKAVDSTGAGDLFHGAFTYGIMKNWPYEKVLRMANVAGALSVLKVGGRNSVPTKEAMKAVCYDFE